MWILYNKGKETLRSSVSHWTLLVLCIEAAKHVLRPMWHPWLLWYTVILVYNCTNQEIWHKLAELSRNPSNFDPKGPESITGSMLREAGDVNCAGSSQNSTVSHTFPWDHVTCQKSFTSMWSSQIGLVSSKTQVDCGSSLSWEVTNFPDVIDECIPFIIADFVFIVPRAP